MFLLNNIKFDINTQHTIGDTQYPRGWFLDPAERAKLGVVEVPDPVRPDDNLFTSVENPDGSWTATPRTEEDLAARLATAEGNRIAALWQAAHDYEFAQVSGSAIGLLAMGVMQAKPKCTAVQDWIKSIWTVYYTRKANGSTDTNFDMAGPCPHSVPELMTELGL